MIGFIVTVINLRERSFRTVEVTANSEEQAKRRVIWGLTGSDTVYDVREA